VRDKGEQPRRPVGLHAEREVGAHVEWEPERVVVSHEGPH